MRKIHLPFLSAAMLCACAGSAYAEVLSPEQALERALASDVVKAPSKTASSYSLAFSKGDAVYVFSSATGFLAVSGDDIAPATLGYSDAAAFDAGAIPPAMNWWLGEYARQIEAARAAGVTSAQRIARAQRSPVAPLVSTQWNQNSPYNDMCPEINGTHAVTGCVATAMAQVMNYHKWPATGTGSKSYSSNGTKISLDFSSVDFDWDEMLDSYSSTSTSASEAAVAQLMYACGVSVEMQYGTSESGASDLSIPSAMVEYFNYGAGIRYYSRDYYGIADWEDCVYSQLVDYGPVQYSGQSNDGGHSFVCDGYSFDGYFHFNWGWGGLSDGYFLLTALDPIQQGIGGSTSGFNFSQSFIGNVARPSAASVMYDNLLMETAFGVRQESAPLGAQIDLTGNIYNFSTGSVSGTLGIKLTDASTGAVTYVKGQALRNMQPLEGVGSYDVTLPSDLDGTNYLVSPAFLTTGGTWQDIPVRISVTNRLMMTVENGTASFSDVPVGSVELTGLELLTPLYTGQLFHLTATMTNPGDSEFYGIVAPALMSGNGTFVAIGDIMAIDLTAGESQPFDYVGTITPYSTNPIADGQYALCVIDVTTYEPVSEEITVDVRTAQSTSCTVTGLEVTGDPEAVDASDIGFTATVNCSAGYFGGTLTVAVFPYSTSSVSAVASFTSDPVYVEAGQSATLTAKGALEGAQPGERYMAAVFSGSKQLTDVVTFTIAGSDSGIAGVVAGAPAVFPTITDGIVTVNAGNARSIRVYSAQGAEVMTVKGSPDSIDISALPAGVYFVHFDYGATGTHPTINRVIRR